MVVFGLKNEIMFVKIEFTDKKPDLTNTGWVITEISV